VAEPRRSIYVRGKGREAGGHSEERNYQEPMCPRTKDRATVILLPLAGIVAVVCAVTGNWLMVPAMLLLELSGVLNLRAMRRRGIDWSGPTTFRELRERQRRTDE
jgi:uncharacterized membrane protein YfcA